MVGTFLSLFLPVWDRKVKAEAGYGWWLVHGGGGGTEADRLRLSLSPNVLDKAVWYCLSSEQLPALSQACMLFSASAAGSRAAGMPAPLLAVALHNLPTVTDGTSQVPLTSLPRTGLGASPVFHPSTPKLLCASQRAACTVSGP